MEETDFSGDYTQRREIINTVNSPEVKALATGPKAEGEKRSGVDTAVKFLMDTGKTAAWVLRPLGAFQAAAIAPIAKRDYKSDSFIGKTGEAFAESGKAFIRELLPGRNSEHIAYEKQVFEKYGANIPEGLKPAAEISLAILTDPAMVAFPFRNALAKGLETAALTQTESGPFRNAVEEAVSFLPMRDQKKAFKLADKADKGNSKAAEKLMGMSPEPDIPESVGTRLKGALGYNTDPLVKIATDTPEKYLQTVDDLPGKAINVNFGRIQTEDNVKQVINNTAELFKGEIHEARRGVQTEEQTRKLAESLGMTTERLLKRRKGEAFSAEQALAARQILVSSGERLMGLAKKIQLKQADDIDVFEFQKQMSTHYAIQSQVSGMTAEAGRALQSFNIQAKSSKAQLMAMDDMMKNMGGQVSPEDFANAIADMSNIEGVNTFIRQSQKATSFDMFLEAWINGLLCGPQTHAVNMLSNTLTASWMIPERLIGSGISKLSGSNAVKAGEALQQTYGMIEGFKDGLRAFAKSMRTGEGLDTIEKVEAGTRKAITAANVRDTVVGRQFEKMLDAGGMPARAVDLLGEGVRLPGRLLNAEDALFKSIGYRMELRARSFRQAVEEGLTGEDAAKRMQDILNNPEVVATDVHLASIDAMRYQTFTKSLGPGGRSFQNTISKIPALRIIVPFVRTPTNILKFAMERTPLAPLSKNIRKEIMAGGARRDMALARISMGSMIMASSAVLASSGHITGGGPSNSSLRSTKRNTGWQPYSIKVGDTYYAYNRLEPVGMTLGLAADMSEILGQVDDMESGEIATAVVMSIAKNTTSKTWMRGMSEVVSAIDSPDTYGKRYIQNFLGSMVPAAVSQAERIISPEMSAVTKLLDGVKSRIPGLSDTLPPRRNVWGEAVTLSGGLGPDIMSPIYTSEKKDSPADEELLRLELPVSMPNKTQSFEGIPLELTPHEYDRFIVLMNSTELHTGKNLKNSMVEMIKEPSYQDTHEDIKIKKIRALFTEARFNARSELINETPVLRQLIDAGHEEKYEN